MKFVVVLCIALQLYVVNSKSLPALPQPCHKSDPNFNTCLIDALHKVVRVLAKGIPEYDIPAMDPYVISTLARNLTFENFAEGTVTLKDMKINNVLPKLKIKNLKVDLNDLTAEIEVFNSDINIGFQYYAKGNLLGNSMHSEGLFKGKFTDIASNLRLKLKPVERKGVKYFTLEYFKLKTHIEGGEINVVASDPDQQKIVDFVQNIFNQNPRPFLDTLKPVYTDITEDQYKSFFAGVLPLVSADVLLPE